MCSETDQTKMFDGWRRTAGGNERDEKGRTNHLATEREKGRVMDRWRMRKGEETQGGANVISKLGGTGAWIGDPKGKQAQDRPVCANHSLH